LAEELTLNEMEVDGETTPFMQRIASLLKNVTALVSAGN
jgi:hypothetical protein